MTKARKIRWQRQNHRQQVLPTEIRGLITHHSKNTQYPFLIWDISEDGIGLWVSTTLEAGENITLTIGQPYLLVIDCRVKWCERQSSAPGFRCGLEFDEQNKQTVTNLISSLKPT